MKGSVNKKMLGLFLFFLVILTAAALFFQGKVRQETEHDQSRNTILALNEIEKRMESGEKRAAREQIAVLQQEIREKTEEEPKEGAKRYFSAVWLLYGISAAFLLMVFLYLYVRVLRPFQKLEDYAAEIAKGNLDAELKYERTNLFGAFTWAFDHMRREIKKARACEKAAIENNKVVIATLSHDIKTPVSSIRAYAEGLEAGMDVTPERRQRYLAVMIKKCDEVTDLTNDLFLHALSDLDKLQIRREPVEISGFLKAAVREMAGETKDIVFTEAAQERILQLDPKRMCQILENLIGNARKYAPGSVIRIWTKNREEEYVIHVKDGGEGICPEDMPFIFQKFYRGKNAEDQPGAGLGLYITRYIMEQMDGEIELVNQEDGMEVVLRFKGRRDDKVRS